MDSFAGDNIWRKISFKSWGICRCDKWKNIDKSGEKCYNISV